VMMKLNYAKSCLKSVFSYIGSKRIPSKAFALKGINYMRVTVAS
jgi:hypothetical protein